MRSRANEVATEALGADAASPIAELPAFPESPTQLEGGSPYHETRAYNTRALVSKRRRRWRAARLRPLISIIISIVLLGFGTGWAASSGHRFGFPDWHSKRAVDRDPIVGVRFSVTSSGTLDGANVFYSGGELSQQVTLRNSRGRVLTKSQWKQATGSGWLEIGFSDPTELKPGMDYILSARSSTSLLTPNDAEPLDLAAPAIDDAVALGQSVSGRGSRVPRRALSSSPVVLPVFVSHQTAPLAITAPTDPGTAEATAMPTDTSTTPGSAAPSTPSTAADPTPAVSESNPSTTALTTSAPASPSQTDNSGSIGVIPSSFPNASNTGVPAGTNLTPYTGPCSIRQDLVISAKLVNCDLMIYSGHVTVMSSKVNGVVISDYETGSLTIEDSEINGADATRNVVGSYSVTVLRSNIYGGQHSVQCWGNCTVQDSWLHGQYVPSDGQQHANAFISNGGSNMKLIHNTLSCDAHISKVDGGCTADASIFGDFGPNTNFTFDGNLFVASTELSYCTYAGYGTGKPYSTQVSGIVYVNNVFQRGVNGKCGLYGPVTGFKPDLPGNVWKNNVWDDGSPLPAPDGP